LITSCWNKFPYVRSHPEWFSPSKLSSDPSHRLSCCHTLVLPFLSSQQPRKDCRSPPPPFVFSPSHEVHWRPPTPSPKLEQGRSPLPAALSDHCHLKVGKTSSPHRPGAIGATPVEDSPPECRPTVCRLAHETQPWRKPCPMPSAANQFLFSYQFGPGRPRPDLQCRLEPGIPFWYLKSGPLILKQTVIML
jgi:hypothetical protein